MSTSCAIEPGLQGSLSAGCSSARRRGAYEKAPGNERKPTGMRGLR